MPRTPPEIRTARIAAAAAILAALISATSGVVTYVTSSDQIEAAVSQQETQSRFQEAQRRLESYAAVVASTERTLRVASNLTAVVWQHAGGGKAEGEVRRRLFDSHDFDRGTDSIRQEAAQVSTAVAKVRLIGCDQCASMAMRIDDAFAGLINDLIQIAPPISNGILLSRSEGWRNRYMSAASLALDSFVSLVRRDTGQGLIRGTP